MLWEPQRPRKLPRKLLKGALREFDHLIRREPALQAVRVYWNPATMAVERAERVR